MFANSDNFFFLFFFSFFSYNHFHTDGLRLSCAQPCSSISSLSHIVQSSTDKKLATRQDRQTLQNSDEKQYVGSLREEYLIPGKESCGRKNVNFLLFFYSTHKKLRGWFRRECLQYARTSCFNCNDQRYKRVCLVHNRLLFLHSGGVKSLHFSVVFLGQDLTAFGFVREEYEKSFENHWSRRLYFRSFESRRTLWSYVSAQFSKFLVSNESS